MPCKKFTIGFVFGPVCGLTSGCGFGKMDSWTKHTKLILSKVREICRIYS